MNNKCANCTEPCPQAERAHEIALGRMYATNEFLSLLKKIDNGELVEVVYGQWKPTAYMIPTVSCSVCFGLVAAEYETKYHYCPNCGAKMCV